jgi:phosphoribosylformylglycinamidine synthase subunit PurQ / glutaminase
MKFGVVVFPGSNCDRDMIHVLQDVMKQEVKVLWHKDHDLQGLTTDDCIVLPGGFSYGDYLRCGAIAKFSPIMQKVIEHANNGGYVWGICNGFQILCESGLLPGALLRNSNQKFICKNVYLTATHSDSALTRNILQDDVLKIPIAHAEGRYYADEATLKNLKKNGQILFQYCDEEGDVTDEANPNGALLNIAGICNEKGNVFGMMPHPERAAEEDLNNIDGRKLFESLLNLNLVEQ